MDKDVLFKRKATDRVETIDLGDDAAVTVRALSRGEVKRMKEDEDSPYSLENRMIAASLVDPVLTPSEVSEWLDEAPAGDSVSVVSAVSRLSGMDEGAAKSDVAGVRDGS